MEFFYYDIFTVKAQKRHISVSLHSFIIIFNLK